MGALIDDALRFVNEHLHGELTDDLLYPMEAFLSGLGVLGLAHLSYRADEVVENDVLLDAVLLEADRDHFGYLEEVLLVADIYDHLLEVAEQLLRVLVFQVQGILGQHLADGQIQSILGLQLDDLQEDFDVLEVRLELSKCSRNVPNSVQG